MNITKGNRKHACSRPRMTRVAERRVGAAFLAASSPFRSCPAWSWQPGLLRRPWRRSRSRPRRPPVTWCAGRSGGTTLRCCGRVPAGAAAGVKAVPVLDYYHRPHAAPASVAGPRGQAPPPRDRPRHRRLGPDQGPDRRRRRGPAAPTTRGSTAVPPRRPTARTWPTYSFPWSSRSPPAPTPCGTPGRAATTARA